MAFREVDPTEIPPAHPVAIFQRFWEKAAAGQVWAPWRAFDALEHPCILPWVLLLKWEPLSEADQTRCWRYAVCGTGCTELFGLSYQGKVFGEDLPPEAAAQRKAEFDRIVGGAGPLFSHHQLPIPEKEFVQVFRGVFPFSTGEGEVDRLLLVIARDDARSD